MNFLIILLFGLTADANEMGRLQDALIAGNATEVMLHTEERIEMALLSQGRLYTQAQAVFVMKEFFRRYPPDSVTIQNSVQEDANWFGTGHYKSEYRDQTLRVYLHLRLLDGTWRLATIRISQLTSA